MRLSILLNRGESIKKIKKIVWFSSGLLQSGGGERLILEGIKHFENMGIETYLLVYNFDKKVALDETYNPNVFLIGKDIEKSNPLYPKLLTSLMRIFILRKKIICINPDIIISQGQWGDSVPPYIATLYTSYPHAVHVFGSMFSFSDEFSKYTFIFKRHFNEIRQSVFGYKEIIPTKSPKLGLIKRTKLEIEAFLKYLSVNNAKIIFVLSNQNKWEVKKLYGRNAIVLRGAFQKSIFDYEPKESIKQKLNLIDKKIILNINRLVPKKRVDLCIRAFEMIAKKRKDVFLVIGGTGPEENNLRELVKQLDLQSYIKFVGFIPEKELWDYYLCCDVFVQLDLADFNIAPFVALALGRKVVWSTEMEIDEDLKQNRFIFPTNPEVIDVVTAIENALTAELCDLNLTEKQILSYYTWENYFSEILREMEAVCES